MLDDNSASLSLSANDSPRREEERGVLSDAVAVGSKTLLGLRRLDDRVLPLPLVELWSAAVAVEPVQRRAAQKLIRVLR